MKRPDLLTPRLTPSNLPDGSGNPQRFKRKGAIAGAQGALEGVGPTDLAEGGPAKVKMKPFFLLTEPLMGKKKKRRNATKAAVFGGGGCDRVLRQSAALLTRGGTKPARFSFEKKKEGGPEEGENGAQISENLQKKGAVRAPSQKGIS